MAQATETINAYLKTATGGKVHAEFAVAVHRWRLVCTECQTTLTLNETYDVNEEYRKNGRLDAGVQQFAKEHLHLKPKFDPYSKQVVFHPSKDVPKPVPVASIPKVGQGAAFNPPDLKKMQEEQEKYHYEQTFAKKFAQWAQKEKELELEAEKFKQQQLLQFLQKMTYDPLTGAIKPVAPPKQTPKPPKKEGRKFR